MSIAQETKQKLKQELSTELSNILDYWKNNTVDEINGGFVGSISGENQVQSEASKGVVLNARLLWTFSSAYRIASNPSDLKMATRAYNYLVNYFIDKEYGGVYWELDYKGNPKNDRKQIYGLSFAIYGLVEYYRVTESENALTEAIKLFALIELYSFDKKQNGYVEALSRKWGKMDDYRLSEIDANESKTMNTHLHILEAYTNLYRVWNDPQIAKALKNLIELFIEKFINQNYNLNLFFDDDWNLKSDEISFGHDIECAWLLFEAAEVFGDIELIQKTKGIAVKMAVENFKGLDSDGGLMNERSPSKNELDTDKHWWPQAEAIIGYFNAYQISGSEEFLNKALSSWEFTTKYIIDHENGEWFWRVNKEGVPNKEGEKAGFWKCPYHNSRACIELIERIKS